MTPTQLTLRELKNNGWTCQVVEKWNPWAKIRQDLFGCIDVVAVHPDHKGVLGIQATTKTHITTRCKKINDNDNAQVWMEAGNDLYVWGWFKEKNKWTHKKVKMLLRP